METLNIRLATPADQAAVCAIISPVIRAGETYSLSPDMSEDAMLAYWFQEAHTVFVAEANGDILGTAYLKANQQGGGSHVANAGFMTSEAAAGRGVARQMCAHILEVARNSGYRAMQFNFVVSTNTRAVALWESLGFETLCRLPEAFRHPEHGYVDSLLMFRML